MLVATALVALVPSNRHVASVLTGTTVIGVGGQSPTLTVAPSPVPFGYVSPGQSKTVPITITNKFSTPTSILGWAATDTGHVGVAAGNCNGHAPGTAVTLGPNASCQAQMTLVNNPPPAGPYPTDLQNYADEGTWDPLINTSNSNAGQTVYVSGFAEPTTSGPDCSPTGTLALSGVVAMARTANDDGYWVMDSSGRLAACGDTSVQYGDAYEVDPNALTAMAALPAGNGYDMVDHGGNVWSFGAAPHDGEIAPPLSPPPAPVVGIAIDPATDGYWLVDARGDVYAFGAPFYGSLASIRVSPTHPIVGIAAVPDGKGYWLVGSDGGIFAFGGAAFHGSTGAITLDKPIVAMAADAQTGGYWLAAADGGVFAFDAPYLGSLPGLGIRPAAPIMAMTASGAGTGYRMAGADGGVFAFGSSGFYGSSA